MRFGPDHVVDNLSWPVPLVHAAIVGPDSESVVV